MRSVKSSVKGWKAAAARLAVVIAIVVQTLGLRAVWAQEPPRPRLDEEMAKQEKIYRSRDSDVPGGYITDRGLSDYLELLPTGFCDALGTLGSSDRWLDIGAGAAQAILDYYAPENEAAPGKTCAGAGGKVRAVAMSIEDRRTDAWRQRVASLGDGRIRYLSGKRLRQYSPEELGKFQIITDVFGGFSYTEDLSEFMAKVLSLLETGGVFHTLVQSVQLENGKDRPTTWYLTKLVDAAGRDVKVCSWLKQTTCVKVACESKSDWNAPTELINIRKVCSDVSVPRMKLLNFEAGNPPGRRFQLEPQRGGVEFKAPVRDERKKSLESVEAKD
jgi:SAM-dependent methyltransferase